MEEVKICIWPNYEWCYIDELDQNLQFRSDDFIIREIKEFEDEPHPDLIKSLVDDCYNMTELIHKDFYGK